MRQALNLPPATRPPLGKGPTGKDKPRTFDGGPQSLLPSSRESSSADSPDSTRTDSLSPSIVDETIPLRQIQDIESSSWEQHIVIPEQSEAPSSSASSNYHLPPMTAPLSNRSPPNIPYPQYSSSLPSSSRDPMTNPMYVTSESPFAHSADRPMSSYGGQGFVTRSDGRDERQAAYSYPHQSYHSHDINMHDPSPPVTTPHSQMHHQPHRESYRRSLTEPHHGFSLSQGYPHIPSTGSQQQQQQQVTRPPSPPRLLDGSAHHLGMRSSYGSDGRIHTAS